MYVCVDERGARGRHERGGGRAVGLPTGAELAGRGQLLRATRAALTAATAAISTRIAEEESVPHGYVDAAGRPRGRHVRGEGVAAGRAGPRRVPRAVPRAPAGALPAARRRRRPRARPAASAAHCREDKLNGCLPPRRRGEHDNVRVPRREPGLPVGDVRRDGLLAAARRDAQSAAPRHRRQRATARLHRQTQRRPALRLRYTYIEGQLPVTDAIHGAPGGGQSGVCVLVLRVLTTCEKPSEVRCECQASAECPRLQLTSGGGLTALSEL